MAKFAYNNAKNTSTGHILFVFNCNYHIYFLYKEEADPWSKSKSTNKLATKLKNLMIMCRDNLLLAQKIQKRHHNKTTRPRSYTPNNKVWSNNKYIKTKYNEKLKAKIFKLFCVLHLVEKQTYKLELLKKRKIHDVFNVSPLEQITTRQKRVDKATS